MFISDAGVDHEPALTAMDFGSAGKVRERLTPRGGKLHVPAAGFNWGCCCPEVLFFPSTSENALLQPCSLCDILTALTGTCRAARGTLSALVLACC